MTMNVRVSLLRVTFQCARNRC